MYRTLAPPGRWLKLSPLPATTLTQSLMIEISQKGVSPDFITLLPVVVTTEKGSIAGQLVARGAITQARIALPAPLKAVEFNPLNAVLCDLKVTKL